MGKAIVGLVLMCAGIVVIYGDIGPKNPVLAAVGCALFFAGIFTLVARR